ncbi:MAG: UDP-N-acetylmuramoyl-L-alanine--D-glutamate ligase [bacterium]
MPALRGSLELRDRRILVVGLARTGIAAARFLLEQGARVAATDCAASVGSDPAVKALGENGCSLRLGEHRLEDFLEAELIVISPGVPLTLAPLSEAVKAGRTVIGEMELASRHLPCPLIGVTGSNGKTTTVSLIHAMLESASIPHWVGGNIGRPLIDFLLEGRERSEKPRFVVAEVSSFQLETVCSLRPWIAVWTNLSEDHLDRYPDLEAYAEAKFRIFQNQTADDYAIVPARDRWLDFRRNRMAARIVRFGCPGDGRPEACVDGAKIVWRGADRTAEELYETERVRLPGRHNLENMMVAAAVARLCGVPPPIVQRAMDTFPGLEHRLELVEEIRGVRFYNDSKGTTVDSVVRALESFSRPVLLLAGGKDKGGAYAPLLEPLRTRARRLFLFGEAAGRMERELSGAVPIERVRDLDEAIRRSWEEARPGDVVLLSPACSSFDMFRDYEHRGETFKQGVRDLVGRVRGSEEAGGEP